MGDAPLLLATAASVDITPLRPVPLAGFANRDGDLRGVADPLEASGVYFSGPDGGALIVSLDLLYAGEPLERRILEHIGDLLSPERVMVCATHTHFAPATDPSKPKLGRVDETYMDFLFERVGTLVDRLLDGSTEPVEVVRSATTASHAVNRRRRTLRRGRLVTDMAPNRRGPNDEGVTLFWVRSPDGTDRALVWNYACHPVGHPARDLVSAEFPGVVRTALRETAPDLPVLFLQGFAGNLRPRVVATPASLRDHVRRALRGPEFGRFTDASWRDWAGGLARAVVACPAGDASRDATVTGRRVEVPLADLLGKSVDGPPVVWQRLTVGGVLDLVAVSGEPFTEFTAVLPEGAIGVGCLGDVFGYYPTDAAVREGGYESAGFLKAFDLTGAFGPGLDDLFVEAIGRLR